MPRPDGSASDEREVESGSFRLPMKFSSQLLGLVALSLLPTVAGGGAYYSLQGLAEKMDKLALNVNTLMAAGTDVRLKDIETRMREEEQSRAKLEVRIEALQRERERK